MTDTDTLIFLNHNFAPGMGFSVVHFRTYTSEPERCNRFIFLMKHLKSLTLGVPVEREPQRWDYFVTYTVPKDQVFNIIKFYSSNLKIFMYYLKMILFILKILQLLSWNIMTFISQCSELYLLQWYLCITPFLQHLNYDLYFKMLLVNSWKYYVILKTFWLYKNSNFILKISQLYSWIIAT